MISPLSNNKNKRLLTRKTNNLQEKWQREKKLNTSLYIVFEGFRKRSILKKTLKYLCISKERQADFMENRCRESKRKKHSLQV